MSVADVQEIIWTIVGAVIVLALFYKIWWEGM
jgi:hypothetical protein